MTVPYSVLGQPITQATVDDLLPNVPYFFVITAQNTSLLTSAHSIEVSETPVFGPGLHPPDFVDDLLLDRVGNDVVLSWGAVTHDIYGKALPSAPTYEVRRGTTPTVLSLLASPGTPTHTDTGAIAGPPYFYWVRAIHAVAGAGALGAERPASILSFLTEPSTTTPGNVVLSWDPVLYTLDGVPIQLQHYAVYFSALPFSRAEIDTTPLAPVVTTTATSIELPPPGGDGYYSVLAVDIRGNASPF
jgi:hypothetical protein